jgi:hypothetical protein
MLERLAPGDQLIVSELWLIAAMHFSTLTGGSATGAKDTQ